MDLKRLKNILLQCQICSMYYALTESYLHYDDVIWYSFCKTKLIALQLLKTRACSIIKSANIKVGWSCSWLNVENTIRYDRNMMTYKIINRLCPETFYTNTCPDHVFLRTVREILRIYRSLDSGQNFSKRIFIMLP